MKYLAPIMNALWDPELKLPVYALLDGARREKIYWGVVNSDVKYDCLYRHNVPTSLAKVAPYLIQLKPNAEFTSWLLRIGWGDSWGVFLKTEASFKELRAHFRRFLWVRDEAGKKLYFRYYDPRVLRGYLPSCNTEELETIFGPIDSFLVEGTSPDVIVAHRWSDRQLATKHIQLSQG